MLPLSPLLRPKKSTGLSKQETDQEEGMIPTSYGSSLAGSPTSSGAAQAGNAGVESKPKGFTVGGKFYNIEHPMAGMKGTKWENLPKIGGTQPEEEEEQSAVGSAPSILQSSYKSMMRR